MSEARPARGDSDASATVCVARGALDPAADVDHANAPHAMSATTEMVGLGALPQLFLGPVVRSLTSGGAMSLLLIEAALSETGLVDRVYLLLGGIKARPKRAAVN